MRLFYTLSIVLLAGLGAQQAAAQCLPLASFSTLAVETGGATPPAIVDQILARSEWQYKGPVGNTKEIYWTSAAAEGETPEFRLSLRPVLQRYDVVLKTSVASCVKQLRNELTSRKLKPEPITCPDCEGQRFTLPEGGTVSFYSNMKGAYPLVVVIHPAETPASGDTSKTATTRNP
jgi:hypothetical protein